MVEVELLDDDTEPREFAKTLLEVNIFFKINAKIIY